MLVFVEKLGLKSQEAHLLELLFRSADERGQVRYLTYSKIAAKLAISPATAKRLVNSLVERGFIKKIGFKTSSRKTFLNFALNFDLPILFELFVDYYQQQDNKRTKGGQILQLGSVQKPTKPLTQKRKEYQKQGGQNCRQTSQKPEPQSSEKAQTEKRELSEKEKEAIKVMVRRAKKEGEVLKRVPVHKALFFMLNSPFGEDYETSYNKVWIQDQNPGLKNPVGFLVVSFKVVRDKSVRWEWLTSPDEVVPEEILEFWKECEEELEREEQKALKRKQEERKQRLINYVHAFVEFCKKYGVIVEESEDELVEMILKADRNAGYVTEDYLTWEKLVTKYRKLIAEKLLQENKELKKAMADYYYGLKRRTDLTPEEKREKFLWLTANEALDRGLLPKDLVLEKYVEWHNQLLLV